MRRAERRDLSRVVDLWTEITQHHAPLDSYFTLRSGAEGDIRKLLLALLRDPDTATFLYEEGSEVQGLCIARIDRAQSILEESRRAEITDLGVRVDRRRRGIGRALTRAALDWIAERGVTRVEVRVATRNAEGQAFWRALGFEDLMDVLQRRL